MANTRDIIGDNATLAGLVGGTLTELEEDSVPILRAYALYTKGALTHIKLTGTTEIQTSAMETCTGLTEIGENDLPSVTTIKSNAFNNCSNLTSAIFPSLTSISGSFSNCKKLAHLVLAKNSVCNLTGNLSETAISHGFGAVYVPSNLVDTYKADSRWNKYLIVPLSSYPLSSFDTIPDSWDTIIGYANAGTIGDHYSVGDTKVFTTTDGITYYAQLVGINKDPLSSDATKTANSSWLLKMLLSTTTGAANTQKMNSSHTTVGGWASCALRTYLNDTWILTLPTNIQNAIKTVNKPYYRFEDTSEQISADKIWIPSSHEVNLEGYFLKETTGVVYDSIFKTADSTRIRVYTNGSADGWWLRSASIATNFICVNSSGRSSSNGAADPYGVLPGFCI